MSRMARTIHKGGRSTTEIILTIHLIVPARNWLVANISYYSYLFFLNSSNIFHCNCTKLNHYWQHAYRSLQHSRWQKAKEIQSNRVYTGQRQMLRKIGSSEYSCTVGKMIYSRLNIQCCLPMRLWS